MKRNIGMLSVILGLVLLVGCAKAPTQEVKAARDAMNTASAAGAADYAQASWSAAQDAQSRMEAELQAQENASAISRSYDQARILVAEATAAAQKAEADAVAGKERVQAEAFKTVDEAKLLRDEVQKLVDHAPQGKGTVADVAALKADAAETETTVKEAEDALNAGRFKEAKAKADAAIEALNNVKTQIRTAEQARNARRRV